MQEAVDKKIALVEIIPGKGSGALKKKVIRFLTNRILKICITGLKGMIRTLGAYLSISNIDPAVFGLPLFEEHMGHDLSCPV